MSQAKEAVLIWSTSAQSVIGLKTFKTSGTSHGTCLLYAGIGLK